MKLDYDFELLPCPFCGTIPNVEYIGNNYTQVLKVKIKCPKCRVQRTDSSRHSDFEWLGKISVEHWNERYKIDI